MSYVVNTSKQVRLTIGGVNYSSNVIDIQLSDESAFNNGIVATNGTIVLGYVPGGSSIEDYAKQFFDRGQSVLIEISNGSGGYITHPRGWLYVVDSSYDIEENKLSVDVGCKLYLASLSDDVSELLGYTTIPLSDDKRTYSDLSNALQAESKFIWQSNTGSIVKTDFFLGDGTGTNRAQGLWTSVLGVTAINTESLGGSTITPDFLEVSFEFTEPQSSEIDPAEDFDQTIVTTKYTIDFPSVEYVRVRPEDGIGGTNPNAPATVPAGTGRGSDACGDSPIVPGTGGGEGDDPIFEACTEGYEAIETTRQIEVENRDVSTTYYQAVGRQASKIIQEDYDSKLQHNDEYWKDLIEFCRFGFGTKCDPDGGCVDQTTLEANNSMRSSLVIEDNYYGDGGILIRKNVETFEDMFDCYTPSDWRYGVKDPFSDAVISKFRKMHLYTGPSYEYMSSRVLTEYQYFDSHTIETTTTWTSDCGKESTFYEEDETWIQRIRDAYPWGKKRVVKKITSKKTTEREEQKSTDPTTVTRTLKIGDVKAPKAYIEPPTESGAIIMQTSLPLIVGGFNASYLAATRYLRNYRRFLEGESKGIRVIEALRSEIITGWFPSMPFRFYDSRYEKVFGLRMNACSWGLSQTEAVVSTDGIFIGVSNGVLSEADGIPLIINETSVTPAEGITEVIEVNLRLSAIQTNGGGDSDTGIVSAPVDTYFDNFATLVIWVSGAIFEPGSLLATDENGGVPIANGSTLVTTGAVVVNADLFTP